MLEICRKYVGNMLEICRKYVGNMLEIYRKYVGNMLEICWKYVVKHIVAKCAVANFTSKICQIFIVAEALTHC